MNIRNVTTAASEPVKTREQGATRRAAAAYGRATSGSGGAPPAQTTATPQDRVTISDEARARQAADAERASTLDIGHEALGGLPDLTDEQVAELRARVDDGYYSRPEQTLGIADRLAAMLRGEAPGA